MRQPVLVAVVTAETVAILDHPPLTHVITFSATEAWLHDGDNAPTCERYITQDGGAFLTRSQAREALDQRSILACGCLLDGWDRQ